MDPSSPPGQPGSASGAAAVTRTDSIGRQSKPRPDPLPLPRDRSYGTAATTSGGGAAGSGNSKVATATGVTDQSSLLGSQGVGNTRGSGVRGSGAGRRSSDSMPLWNYATSPSSPLIQIRDHCHQQWVAVVFTILLLLVTFYFVFGLSAPMRAEQCSTPFSTLLGENSGVAAYSNCRNDYAGDGMEHYVFVGLQRLYTGARWHALEYARRYWILSSLLTFPSLNVAEHLFFVESANAVNGRRGGRGSSVVPLERYTNLYLPRRVVEELNEGKTSLRLNGETNNVTVSARLMNWRRALVQVNDLVVYAKDPRTLPMGHVAVVTAVQGPFHGLAAAGKDVHWYVVKNATSRGRQPMAPESQLPHTLLKQQHGSVGSVEAGEGASAAPKEPGVESVTGRSVLYYKIYVAEQNWDNRYWGESAFINGMDAVHANLTSAGKPLTGKQLRKAAARVRNYTRVLLLHEYSNPHGFFLEDTHNNAILGWMRPAPGE